MTEADNNIENGPVQDDTNQSQEFQRNALQQQKNQHHTPVFRFPTESEFDYLLQYNIRLSIDLESETIQSLNEFHEYNIAILGQAQSGQTALSIRLSNKQEFIQTQKSTELLEYIRDIPEKKARLHIFDLIGMTNTDIMKQNALIIKYCQFVFVTFSLDDPKWQQNIHNWMLFIKSVTQNCRIIAVGNKCDLPYQLVKEQVQDYIDTSKQVVKVVFCSAKTGEGIDDLLDLPWFTKYKFKQIKLVTKDQISELRKQRKLIPIDGEKKDIQKISGKKSAKCSGQ